MGWPTRPQALREELDTQKKTAAATKAELNALYQQELKLRQSLETTLDNERLLRGEAESRATHAIVRRRRPTVEALLSGADCGWVGLRRANGV